jgi:magnesium transporter
LDEFDEYLFLVTHEPAVDPDTRELQRPEIDFFLGKNYLVTIHKHTSSAIEKTIHRCNTELLHHQALMYQKGTIKSAIKDNMMFRNSDFVLHAILDSIVDSYFLLVDRWDEDITDLEERVLSPQPNGQVLNEILTIKRQLSAFRRTLAPQRDVLARLVHSDNKAISKFSHAYFRDVYDHLIRVNEILDAHRDMMGNILDAYYSMLSHQINENSQKINVIMQRLTIITTIFMPLSFISGVYGMNFRIMPERDWEYGYYMALGFMGFVGGSMYYVFRKKKWF